MLAFKHRRFRMTCISNSVRVQNKNADIANAYSCEFLCAFVDDLSVILLSFFLRTTFCLSFEAWESTHHNL